MVKGRRCDKLTYFKAVIMLAWEPVDFAPIAAVTICDKIQRAHESLVKKKQLAQFDTFRN